jgi:type II secretory pathway pseudopilin PulG
MKCLATKSIARKSRDAFTLVETLIASATLVIVIGSVIGCNLFGLAMAVRQQIWMGASDDACRAISTMMQDIRAANSLEIGNFGASGFVPDNDFTNQTGNALMIFPTTNTVAPYTLYYYDTVSNNLIRSNFVSSGSVADVRLISANPITNDNPIFTEVTCTNTVQTNARPMSTVSVYLSFTKLQDPQVVIENGSLVDLYQIVLCISPRIDL